MILTIDVATQTSINFLTHKKFDRENLNKGLDHDHVNFKETWSRVNVAAIYLSKIKDFDALDCSKW